MEEFIVVPEVDQRESKIIQANDAKLLVVTTDISSDDVSRSTMMSIISALKLNAKTDVTFVFKKNESCIFSEDLLDGISLLLLFGTSPSFVNLNCTHVLYKLLKFEKFDLIITDEIAKMNADKSLKVKLWNILKELQL